MVQAGLRKCLGIRLLGFRVQGLGFRRSGCLGQTI